MRELVSIILPTYNRAQLLPRAVDSVLSQTYENWELIIWNDGSTDNTHNVLENFKDKRITFYKEDNQGKSYALNQGLRLAKGQIVAFLDDDDVWLPKKVEIQVAALQKHPELDMVFGDFENINITSNIVGFGFDQASAGLAQLLTEKVGKNLWFVREGFLKGIGRDNFIAFDSVAIQKRMIDRIGLFNEKLLNSEDFEYWWRFGLAGGKAAYTETVLLKRYKYANSLSSRSIIAIENYIKTLDLCAEITRTYNNEESVNYLLPAYRNAWQNKVIIHGTQGEKKMAWHAFKQSLKFGFSLGTVKLIMKALFFANSLSSSTQQ
ncbi:MAG: glycosyltransferase [Syntrophaceae bacterium]|nr:glycosyltransferase [Syntrophaceae bacterium]